MAASNNGESLDKGNKVLFNRRENGERSQCFK